MLVLTRKLGDAIQIGPHVRVRVVSLHAGQVRLAIEAPDHVRIHREEIYQRIVAANREATHGDPEALRAWTAAATGSKDEEVV